MKKKISIKKFEIISTIFAIIMGTLLHFTYEWSNNNSIVGLFSAINESTWEHLKILFFPMLITTIIGYFYYKKDLPNYLYAKTKGILVALSFVVVTFYTYTGVIGKSFGIINILIFIIAIIVGEIYAYKKIKSNTPCNNLISKIMLLILSISFITFTFKTPHIGIFKDPVNGSYGINQ